MAWSTIRPATQADQDALTAAAERFCRRHGIKPCGEPVAAVQYALDDEGYTRQVTGGRRRLAYSWRRVVRRALGHDGAEGIAFGYVGFHVD